VCGKPRPYFQRFSFSLACVSLDIATTLSRDRVLVDLRIYIGKSRSDYSKPRLDFVSAAWLPRNSEHRCRYLAVTVSLVDFWRYELLATS
jgi:hypothetical protein